MSASNVLGEIIRVKGGKKGVVYRTVPGHEKYAVGTDGTFWSLRCGVWRKARVKIGYPTVTMYVGAGKNKHYTFHKILALAHLGPRPEGMQVCHEDGDPNNRRLDNIRYGTPKSNSADRIKHGHNYEGEEHHLTMLTNGLVEKIREEFANGKWTLRAFAKKHELHPKTMSDLLRGKTWKTAGGPIWQEIMPKHKPKWFPPQHEVLQILEMHKTGKWSLDAIAGLFGLTDWELRYVLRRNGIGPSRNPKPRASDVLAKAIRLEHANGKSKRSIARERNLPEDQVHRILIGKSNPLAGGPVCRQKKYVMLEKKIEAVSLFSDGATTKEVIRATGLKKSIAFQLAKDIREGRQIRFTI